MGGLPDRLRRFTILAALIIGGGLVANGLYIPAKARLAQILIARAWQESLSGGRPVAPWPWADTVPVARLEIEGGSRALYVLRGASGQSLAFGPAHVSSSAPIGSMDNIALAGHRDTHFAILRDLEKNHAITLESPDGVKRYVVTRTEIVHESRIDLLDRTGRPELTLITCHPFDAIVPGGPWRYVVHAELDASVPHDATG